MRSTFIDRTNTNEGVLAEANKKARKKKADNEIKLFSEVYKDTRRKRRIQVLQSSACDPIRYTTLELSGDVWNFPNKRVGRVKIWDQIREKYEDTPHRELEFKAQKN